MRHKGRPMKNFTIYYLDGKKEKSHTLIRMNSASEALSAFYFIIGKYFVTRIEERKL